VIVKTTWALACVLSVGIFFPVAAEKHDSLVRFDGGIGVIPVSNVAVAATGAVTVTRNIVRDANPAGQIWVIDALKADVDTDGRIRVRGRGLLLGGGNNIGFSIGASVFATLYCGPSTAFTAHSTDKVVGVTLEPNGDFRIDDVLNPTPPADCASPILLIRNLAGSWFAAGIQKLDHDGD
jgi:hypothetical protein